MLIKWLLLSSDDMRKILKVKEKSAMENHFFDFAKTRDALGQLSADIIELENILVYKKDEIEKNNEANKKNMASQEKIIATLRNTTQKALDEVESINNYISGVL